MLTLRRRWADLPLRAKGLAILVVPLILLAAAVMASISVADHQNSYTARTRAAVTTSNEASALLVSLLNAETGVRGYLATRNPTFLAPWHAARTALPGQLDQLADSRDLSLTDRRAVQTTAHTVITELRELIERERSGPIAQVSLNTSLLASKAAMDVLRSWVSTFHAGLQRTLSHGRARVDALRTEAEVIAFVGLIGGLLGVLGMFLFIRRVARRIDDVTAAAHRLGLGERLPEANGGEAQDELGHLSGELRQASDLLASRSAEMLTAHRTALAAVSDKNAFLSHLGHELRTPLTAIAGFGQLLSTSDALNDDDAECVSQIVLATQHLIALTDEVRGAGHDEDPLPIECEPVALPEIVAEAMALMGPIAAERAVTLTSEVVDDAVASADRRRLLQVVINLISNAIKYNEIGGSVHIAATFTESRQVRLSVADTGLGIPEELQPRVFAPHERLGAEATDTEGSGIGLALSRTYVEAMGGAISLESTEGQGSTFVVDLVPAQLAVA